jgi:hypothetical protein
VSGIRRLSLALASDGGIGTVLTRCSGLRALERVLWNDAEPGLCTGVLPPGVDEPRLLADLVAAVGEALTPGTGEPVGPPVRLALHEGLSRLDGGQFRGPALDAVRELSRVSPSAPLTVVVSRRIFEDLAALDVQPLPLDGFRPVRAAFPALAAGWPL